MRFASFALLSTVGIFAASSALAAAQVNIVDPTITARVAHVDAGDRLAVQEVPPVSFFHADHFGVTGGAGCYIIATAPRGKALIVRQVRVNVLLDPSPGAGDGVTVYLGTTCSGANVGDINPPTLGLTTMMLDPGVAVPEGSGLSALALGNVEMNLQVDGYTVAPSVAPVVGEVFQVRGRPRH